MFDCERKHCSRIGNTPRYDELYVIYPKVIGQHLFVALGSSLINLVIYCKLDLTTPPGAPLGLLPVPSPDNGRGLGMRLATPSRRRLNR